MAIRDTFDRYDYDPYGYDRMRNEAMKQIEERFRKEMAYQEGLISRDNPLGIQQYVAPVESKPAPKKSKQDKRLLLTKGA